MVTMFFAQPIVDSFSMHANTAKGYQLLHGKCEIIHSKKNINNDKLSNPIETMHMQFSGKMENVSILVRKK